MPSPASTERPPGLLRRVRHELQRRDVRVSRVQPLGTGLQAVTFCGPALASFVSLSFDDHIKFIFTDAAGQEQRRDHTPRHFDAARQELTLVFALHEGGAASDWALRAQVGDAAVIGGPRGSIIVPDDLPWYLLVGDATALPAIARRLEELPSAPACTCAGCQPARRCAMPCARWSCPRATALSGARARPPAWPGCATSC